MEWLFTLIMNISLGSILIVCGYLIWKKQKISLIRRYHYKRVKDQDRKNILCRNRCGTENRWPKFHFYVVNQLLYKCIIWHSCSSCWFRYRNVSLYTCRDKI